MRAFPDGKRFAFTIIDDTDGSTIENTRPIYDLLSECGFRTSKTVWPLDCPEGSRHFYKSKTLEDPEYLQFVYELRDRGFEIAYHGATMESSRRERTQLGLDRYRELFGSDPRVYANHSTNQENVYWGTARVDSPVIRSLYRIMTPHRGRFLGDVPESPYWWGDLCKERITYVRNLTFTHLNVDRANPSMPYQDPRRPYVNWFYSTADADDCGAFNLLVDERAQDELAAEGGIGVVTTHFAKGFVKDGVVNARTRELLTRLGKMDGWFVPLGELLDWMHDQRTDTTVPEAEWQSMQRVWFRDLVSRHFRRLFR